MVDDAKTTAEIREMSAIFNAGEPTPTLVAAYKHCVRFIHELNEQAKAGTLEKSEDLRSDFMTAGVLVFDELIIRARVGGDFSVSELEALVDEMWEIKTI